MADFKKGDVIQITASNYATGQKVPQWVKDRTHVVYQVDEANGRVLVGHPDGINSWIPINGLQLLNPPDPPAPAPIVIPPEPVPLAAPAPAPVTQPAGSTTPPPQGLDVSGILNGGGSGAIVGSADRIELYKHVRPAGDDSIKASLEKINRFRYRYPDQELENTIGHVFFSRPNMNFFQSDGVIAPDIRKFDFFLDLYNSAHGYKLLQSLCAPKWGGGMAGPFIYVLHNYAENFEIPDLSIKTTQSAQSRSGYSISMGGKFEIPEGPTTSIKYYDDRQLSIFKLHKAWVEYIHLVTSGRVEAKEGYRLKKEIDYACSAYFFLCAEDGFTILFWAKCTGMFPVNIPSSQFGWQKGNFNRPELSIEYKYTGPPDIMRPIVLSDFNNICQKHGALKANMSVKSIYDDSTYSMFDPWRETPIVRYNKQRDVYELHMA